jgi:hypothetical protein
MSEQDYLSEESVLIILTTRSKACGKFYDIPSSAFIFDFSHRHLCVLLVRLSFTH